MTEGAHTTCGSGMYVRDAVGVWRYAWGEPVPGAADVLAHGRPAASPSIEPEAGGPRWLREGWLPLDLSPGEGVRRDLVGMRAPETACSRMLTREELDVLSPLTAGALPPPQAVLPSGEALWAWPVVRGWLSLRDAPAGHGGSRSAAT
jgi:hypothetical protein